MDARQWSDHLRAVARPVLDEISEDDDGRDELGNRPMLAQAFLNWRRGIGAPCIAGAPTGVVTESADTLLWRALVDPTLDVDDLLTQLTESHERCAFDRGALLPQGAHRTLEVWTESELAAIHALSWLAATHERADWADKAASAVAWHVEHLQPDNATNHPWSVHLFILHDIRHDAAEAGLYAETMIHNCRVMTGRPDRFSARILEDAADALLRMGDVTGG